MRRPLWVLIATAAGLFLGVGAKAAVAPAPELQVRAEAVASSQSDSSRERNARPDNSAAAPRVAPESEPATRSATAQTDGIDGAARAVKQYAVSLGDDARVGAAIVPLDVSSGALVAGTTAEGPAWSVMKVPTAAAYLGFKAEQEGAPSGEATLPEGSQEREDLGRALVQSDNLSIRRRVQEMLEAEGPDRTATRINESLQRGGISAGVSPAIDPEIDSLDLGTTEWTLDQVAEWFRRLQVDADCLGLAEDDRQFLLRQLRAAPTALPWGAAAVLDPSSIALKPGWGAGSSTYTVEQAVIVGNGSEADGFPSLEGGYVMVLMATVAGTDDSAFANGQEHLAHLASLISDEMGTTGTQAQDLTNTC